MTEKKRARDYGIPLRGIPGEHNNITDVPGVEVGYSTLSGYSADVNTGVTSIFCRGSHRPCIPCSAGIFSLNGNGELTGSHWVEERGAVSTPIVLTNTLAVGTCHRALIDWINTNYPDAGGLWMLPVVAETFDGYLSDIRGNHITPEHVYESLRTARGNCRIEEGGVGGGCGMTSYGYRAGSGSSSRVVPYGTETYHVGVFVQANFGKRHQLTIAGIHIGDALSDDNPMGAPSSTDTSCTVEGAGSIIVIVATDAPMLPGQCKALARRVSMGIARTGSSCSHFSGDIFLAFSTANDGALTSEPPPSKSDPANETLETLQYIPWGRMDRFYEAVVHATEEAIINALFAGEETVGFKGHRVPGLPIEKVVDILQQKMFWFNDIYILPLRNCPE